VASRKNKNCCENNSGGALLELIDVHSKTPFLYFSGLDEAETVTMQFGESRVRYAGSHRRTSLEHAAAAHG
jgi:hypothetical protein